MIYNDDGTFTWENGDILTAEKMNKLLSQDDCGIIFLEEKREGQPPQNYRYIEASYNDLKNWIEENKIICLVIKGSNTEPWYQFSEYSLLKQLVQQNNPIDYIVYFKNNYSFESSNPDANLIRIKQE